MINRFKVTGPRSFLHLLDFLLHAVDDFLHLELFDELGVEPIDAGDVRRLIKSQRRIVAEKPRDRDAVGIVNEQGTLTRRTVVRTDLDLRAGNGSFDAGLYLLNRFHKLFL